MRLYDTMDAKTCQEKLKKKFAFFDTFWRKEGPYPLLFTEPHLAKSKNYIKYNLVEQHNDVNKLLEDNLLAVEPYLTFIDDGIPTVRPDLGTTLLPSSLGLPIAVQANQHPWLTDHLPIEEYLAFSGDFSNEGEIKTAEQFYHLFLEGKKNKSISPCISPYVPDTQGVFDLSHLILGENIFLYLYDKPELIQEVQQKSLKLFLAATRFFKSIISENRTSMIHGHGMPIGVWFPDTGARISEDSPTLISTKMIEDFVLPYIRKAVTPFGRGFLHYCGRHDDFLAMVCGMDEISTLNLGNPEMYDLDYLFGQIGKTSTVYFGHLPALTGESGEDYLERIADYCKRYKAQLILVSDYHPNGDTEKMKLVNLWHKLTGGIF